MKTSMIAGLVSLVAFVSAVPTDHVRRSLQDRGHHVAARQEWAPLPQGYSTAPFPSGVPWPTAPLPPPYPTGTAPSAPTGTAPCSSTLPRPTGSPSCYPNGALICNGPTQYGLCNWGSVIFQPVADGTACIDGKIVGTGIYSVPTPTPTA